MSDSESADDPPADGDGDRPRVARVDGLRVAFGDVAVFEDVDLAIEGGAVTAVVGANGSGKTTLLRTLAGLLEPTAGRVSVASGGGRPVGYCPQNPRFRAHFTVEETLAFYAELLEREADVSGTLELVGLANVADRRVGALSGGMTRLLGIAQAVLGDPGLLVLDEPASGLDPAIRTHIYETLGDVAATGPGVVVATHHLVRAAGTDRVLVLQDGGVAAEGPPGAVVADIEADSLEEAFLSIVGEGHGVSAGVEVDP